MFQYKRKFAKWPWPLSRQVVDITKYPWVQATFRGNEPIEEVLGYQLTLRSSVDFPISVENERLKTSASYMSSATFPSFAPSQNEDFTIEIKVNVKSQGTSLGTLLAAWQGSTTSSWMLARNPNGTVTFKTALESGSTSGGITITSTDVVPLDADRHVAVVRENNSVYLYVDGVRQQETAETAQGFYVTGSTVTSISSGASFWMEGDRWDIRMCKYAAYGENFTPAPIAPFVRPKYVESSDILVQSLLADSVFNEVTRQPAIVNRVSIESGVIAFNNHNEARVGFPMNWDGVGDFTIETAFRYSYGSLQVFGSGKLMVGVTNKNLYCRLFPSWPSTSSPVTLGTGADLVDYGKDYHIVLERVKGVVTLYLNGMVQFSFVLEDNVPSSELYMTTTYGSPAPTKRAWNIRAAKKALYNGNVQYNNFYPSLPITATLETVSKQLLVGVTPNNEVNDANVHTVQYQLLVRT